MSHVETLEEKCRKRNILLLYLHRVMDIEMKDGKVSAVITQDPGGTTRVNCKACVLASGSWICNKKIMDGILESAAPSGALPARRLRRYYSLYTGAIELD